MYTNYNDEKQNEERNENNSERADYGKDRYGRYQESDVYPNSSMNAGSTGNNSANRYYQYQYGGSYEPPKPEKKKTEGPVFWKKALTAGALGLILGCCAGVGLFTVNTITGAVTKQQVKAEVQAPAPKTTSIATAEESGKVVTTAKTSPAITKTYKGDVEEVAENSMPAVVAITNNYTYYTQDWFGQRYKGESEASGSGIIVGKNDTDLYIATNQHVVSSADSLTVQFIDETTADATLKSQDSSADIAIVTVPLSSLSAETLDTIKVITLGDPDSLKVGQQVVAIGNALGYGQSVTTGIISAVDREVDLSNGTHKLIQTDAAINPGNSGGALLDMDGYLIGINEAKLSGGGIEGMGYAIPISVAQPIMDKLMTKEVQENHGYLGISGADVTDEASKTYSMPKGVYISKAESGLAAAKAGLKKGDIITAFDNQAVSSMSQLQELIQYYGIGETVEITYYTQGSDGYEEKKTSITLTDYPEASKKAAEEKKKQEKEEKDGDESEDEEESDPEDNVEIKEFNIDNMEDLFRFFGR